MIFDVVRPMSESGEPEKLVSVVIPTRNNIGTIRMTIGAVLSQSEKDRLELLIIDGESVDGTAECAAQMGATVHSYKCHGDMRGFARNLGASKARGEFLLFLDSDMELSPRVVEECVATIAGDFDALIIPEVTLGSGLLGRIRSWERSQTQRYDYLCVARFMSKTAFLRAGGFDERILGFEDLDLQATLIELGARIGRTVLPIGHNERQLALRTYIGKRIYYERTARFYRDKHPRLSKLVFSPTERLKAYVGGVRHVRDVPLLFAAVILRALELEPFLRFRLIRSKAT